MTRRDKAELPKEVTRGKASMPAPIAEPMIKNMDPMNLARNIVFSSKCSSMIGKAAITIQRDYSGGIVSLIPQTSPLINPQLSFSLYPYLKKGYKKNVSGQKPSSSKDKDSFLPLFLILLLLAGVIIFTLSSELVSRDYFLKTETKQISIWEEIFPL